MVVEVKGYYESSFHIFSTILCHTRIPCSVTQPEGPDSHLTLLSQRDKMHLLWWIAHVLLSLTAHVPWVRSLECDSTQYPWNERCCNMCPPGERMTSRCHDHTDTKCKPCPSGYYSDSYNFQKTCKSCQGCSMSDSELEIMTDCSTKHDDVCRCKTGFRCKGSGPCLECEKIPPHIQMLPNTASTEVPGTPNSTTRPGFRLGSTPITKPSTGDGQLFSVIVNAMCVCIFLILMFAVSKHKSILAWIGSINHFWSPTKKSSAIHNTEEEEVPMPVQEECGKLERLLDV